MPLPIPFTTTTTVQAEGTLTVDWFRDGSVLVRRNASQKPAVTFNLQNYQSGTPSLGNRKVPEFAGANSGSVGLGPTTLLALASLAIPANYADVVLVSSTLHSDAWFPNAVAAAKARLAAAGVS